MKTIYLGNYIAKPVCQSGIYMSFDVFKATDVDPICKKDFYSRSDVVKFLTALERGYNYKRATSWQD